MSRKEPPPPARLSYLKADILSSEEGVVEVFGFEEDCVGGRGVHSGLKHCSRVEEPIPASSVQIKHLLASGECTEHKGLSILPQC